MNQNVPEGAADWEQRCLETVEQQTQRYKQNLEAMNATLSGAPADVARIISYAQGIDGYYAAYEPICRQLQANGQNRLSTRIAQLRADIQGALTQYEATYADALRTQLGAGGEAPVGPGLNTPAQIKAFEDHLAEMATLNTQMQQQSDAARAGLTPNT